MSYAQGTSESLVIGPETSFKVLPGTVDGYKIPISSPSFTPDRPTFTPNSLTGTPEPRPVQHGKMTIKGSYNLECNPASIVASGKAFFGGHDLIGGIAVAAPVYPHRMYLTAPPLPGFAEERHTDIALYLLAAGFYHGSTTWKFAEQGFMEAMFSGSAGDLSSSGATVVNGTVTDTTGYEPFDYAIKRLRIGGTVIGYAKTEEFTIDRKLIEAIAQDQTYRVAQIGAEIAVFNGRITANLQDGTLLALAIAGDELSMDFWLPHLTGYGMLVELPSLKLKPGSITTNGTGFCEQAAAFDAYGRVGAGIPGRVWSGYWTTATLPALNGLTLIVSGDTGANETVTFSSPANVDAVATQFNASINLRARMVIDRRPGDTGGVMRIESLTNGTASSIEVKTASTADALLGFSNSVFSGLTGKSIVVTVLSPLAA